MTAYEITATSPLSLTDMRERVEQLADSWTWIIGDSEYFGRHLVGRHATDSHKKIDVQNDAMTENPTGELTIALYACAPTDPDVAAILTTLQLTIIRQENT